MIDKEIENLTISMKSNQFVKEILDGIEIGVILLDNEGKIIFANKASEEILRKKGEILVGKRLLSLFTQEFRSLEGKKDDGQIFLQKKEGGGTLKLLIGPYHDFQGRESGKIVNVQDMSQIYKMQEEILKIDRLACLGEFSSSLAHEIRNPLAGIKTTAQALGEELEDDDSKKEYIDRIIKEIDRLNELLRTFFSFAKPGRINLTPCRIQDVIREVKGVLAKEAEKSGIKIKEIYSDDIPFIRIDFNQIQQVFMNLFLNALQAMPFGGEITVESSSKNLHNGWFQVKVKDTGKGIAQEYILKIFDPFFTTKSKGLGLGLAITHKIIEDHGGKIEVESTLGKGSTFILHFPVGK